MLGRRQLSVSLMKLMSCEALNLNLGGLMGLIFSGTSPVSAEYSPLSHILFWSAETICVPDSTKIKMKAWLVAFLLRISTI